MPNHSFPKDAFKFKDTTGSIHQVVNRMKRKPNMKSISDDAIRSQTERKEEQDTDFFIQEGGAFEYLLHHGGLNCMIGKYCDHKNEKQNGRFGTKMYDLALLTALFISIVLVIRGVIVDVRFKKGTGPWLAAKKSTTTFLSYWRRYVLLLSIGLVCMAGAETIPSSQDKTVRRNEVSCTSFYSTNLFDICCFPSNAFYWDSTCIRTLRMGELGGQQNQNQMDGLERVMMHLQRMTIILQEAILLPNCNLFSIKMRILT